MTTLMTNAQILLSQKSIIAIPTPFRIIKPTTATYHAKRRALPAQQEPIHTPRTVTRIVGRAFMPAASEPAQQEPNHTPRAATRIATRAQVPALHMPNQNRRANPHSEPQQQGALPAQQGPIHTPRAATRIATRAQVPALQIPNQNRRANPPPRTVTRIVGRAFMPAASEPAQHMQTTRATCKLRIATRAQVPALHMPNHTSRTATTGGITRPTRAKPHTPSRNANRHAGTSARPTNTKPKP